MKLAIFGAAPDTGNLGVNALLVSTLNNVLDHIPDATFLVFDHGKNIRQSKIVISENRIAAVTLAGAHGGKRYYRHGNIVTMNLLAGFGKTATLWNPVLRELASCDAALDISGGDSFSDIYGQPRFNAVMATKTLCQKLGIPLILMPQTYGPYNAPQNLAAASAVVQQAKMAWARDKNSFDILTSLLGANFDANVHKCGVDLAFSLPQRPLDIPENSPLASWLADDATNVIGFNVNGLIYNDPARAKSDFRFKADYADVIVRFLTWILKTHDHKVILMQHVLAPRGHYESDLGACEDVLARLPAEYQDRVAISPADLDQSQAKWIIARTDWFCGTRMHATIAGLSSGIPTATISYSDKAKGVFASCGQESSVFDPRQMTDDEILTRLQQHFESREQIGQTLKQALAITMETANRQAAELADFLKNADG